MSAQPGVGVASVAVPSVAAPSLAGEPVAGPAVASSRAEVDDLLAPHRAAGRAVALVPTMGALHEGHATLLRAARAQVPHGVLVVSVFVNPTQFAPGEDLDRYPRTLEADLALCAVEGVDVVLVPSVDEVYPAGTGPDAVTVDPGPLAGVLEGASRPTHFRGVLTVVAKLLGLVRPQVAVFGEKDYQQLVLVRRMAADLCLGVRVVGAPTARADDGLALSSRNAFLDRDERERAAALHRALRAVARDAAHDPDRARRGRPRRPGRRPRRRPGLPGADRRRPGPAARRPAARGHGTRPRRGPGRLDAPDRQPPGAPRCRRPRTQPPRCRHRGRRREQLMLRTMMTSKIHRATVTQADLHYVGSVTVDEDLLDAADLLAGELVHIVDITNGARLETYTIAGERGSGVIGINGAAARLVHPGDLVILIAYGQMDTAEAREHQPHVVFVDADNKVLATGFDPAEAVAGSGLSRGDVTAPGRVTAQG